MPDRSAASVREAPSRTSTNASNRRTCAPSRLLDYVGRYTHRVAISNNRLLSMDDDKVRFRWKDYVRREGAGG
jgi:hypothetical protein